MLVVRSALVRGRRAGLLTVLGVGSGLFVHATLSALGLSALLLRSARAFELVKLAGALYLVFLGIQALRGAARPGPARAEEPAAVGERRAFVEGLLWLSLVTLFVARLRPVLARPRVQRGLEGLTGAVFIAFGVWLATSRS